MGTGGIGAWQIVDADTSYRVFVDAFESEAPEYGCTGEYLGRFWCIVLGSNINYWFAMDWECAAYRELCQYVGYSAQRLITMYPLE